MSMFASIPMRRRCEIVGARLVRPGVRLNLELGQFYSLSEVSISSGYINVVMPLHSHSSWGETTTTTSPSIKVQFLGNETAQAYLCFFLSDKCKSTNWSDRQTAKKRDKPLHELNEGRADYKALAAKKKRMGRGFTRIVYDDI